MAAERKAVKERKKGNKIFSLTRMSMRTISSLQNREGSSPGTGTEHAGNSHLGLCAQ